MILPLIIMLCILIHLISQTCHHTICCHAKRTEITIQVSFLSEMLFICQTVKNKQRLTAQSSSRHLPRSIERLSSSKTKLKIPDAPVHKRAAIAVADIIQDLATPITPHASRAPALPVVLLSS